MAETINIDIDAPDASEFASASVLFQLSGADADSTTGETIPAYGVSVDLDASGEGSVALWAVDRGALGRHYAVTLYARDLAGAEVREYPLGTIQPTDGDGPFTLGELLNVGAGAVTPGVYRVVTEAEYDAIIAAAATATTQAGIATTQAGIATTQATAAAASATAASDDADAAAASATAAAASATAAENSEDSAAADAILTSADAAATAADRLAVETLAAGANADYIVATYADLPGSPTAGEIALILEDENAGNLPTFRLRGASSWGDAVPISRDYSSTTAMAATGGSTGEVRRVADSGGLSSWVWVGGNQTSKVALDWLGGVYIPPATDATGASGVWKRIAIGEIFPEWFGATGGADDTEAIVCCDQVFRSESQFLSMIFSDTYTTGTGIGELVSTATYATHAAATADLGSLSDYEIVTVTADETDGGDENRYWINGGAMVGPLSGLPLNGKAYRGIGGSKLCGLLLKGSSHANMRLASFSTQGGEVSNMLFNGNNPSSQWGTGSAPQNNPSTVLLVYAEGYGLTWRDNTVRHSGGDGAKFRGIIGNFKIEGGQNVFQYCVGRGLVIDRMSSMMASQLWLEGNEDGGLFFDNTLN